MVALRESFPSPAPSSGSTGRPARPPSSRRSTTRSSKETDFGTYESVTYAGARGDPIQMWVSYPPGFDKSKKYPLYLLIHGGPHNGDHERDGVPVERAGVQQLGLRDRVAELPRIERLRKRVRRLDQPAAGRAAVRGRDQGRGVVRAAAVDRPGEAIGGRRQLRRLPDLDRPGPQAPVQSAGRARGGLQLVHAGGRRLRRRGAPVRRDVAAGAGEGVPRAALRTSARRTSTRRRSSSTAPATSGSRSTTGSSSTRP